MLRIALRVRLRLRFAQDDTVKYRSRCFASPYGFDSAYASLRMTQKTVCFAKIHCFRTRDARPYGFDCENITPWYFLEIGTFFDTQKDCLTEHLIQKSLICLSDKLGFFLVETAELESATPCMSSKYSNQLSYASVFSLTCVLYHKSSENAIAFSKKV